MVFKSVGALAGWLSWLEHPSERQKEILGLSPGEGTNPGCAFDPM